MAIPLDNITVKVSGMHTHDKNEGEKILETLYRKDTVEFKKMNAQIIQDLTKKSKIEANAGAKIIVWAENSFLALKKDEDSLINELKKFAKQNSIYLVVTPYVINNGTKSENKTLLLSPNDPIISTHYKYGGNFLEGTVEGNKIIKTIKTPYGNLTSIVCWDGDFPSIVKQVGAENTDVLLIPASDWKEVNPLHATIAIFRGIENGCSVVRQTRNGLSFMTDPRGKIMTRMDHFETNSWIMSGQVPNKKMWTLYPIIGDLFGWLSLIGFIFLLIKSVSKNNNWQN
ncbi:nitrilase-related carbon-nitrogen hydrolase [Flavobacterium sp.]|uniref:nitrilase-related carbon-nitrogen hydrolase n=1 Tax=Flavobacterium sp. TaxID=239 RepID=UPI00286E4D4C|nr:nitrilase-related carbon-nitrogen hydrolase [Flavobacterium sp.]